MSDHLPEIITRFVGDARPLLAATAEARAAVKAYAEDVKKYQAEQTATVSQSQRTQADEVKRYQAEQAAALKRYQAEQVASTRQYTAEQSAETKRYTAEQLAAQRTADSEKAAELARFQAEEKASTARFQAEQLAATRRFTAEQNALIKARLAEQKMMQAKAAEESGAQKALTKVVGKSPIGEAVGGETFMGLGAGGMAIGGAAVATVALIGVGLAVTDIGVRSVKMAADFESATTRLITSAGESHKNIDLVRKGLVDMSAQVGVSAQDLATAMYTVESGSFHGADGLKVLRAAVEGAKAENADLGKVTDAVTTILVDYHLKADDAAMVTTKLVAATSAGKTTFEELTGAMHSVMPIASAAHISINDILGDLAAMTIHGYSAQQATQNLADVIRHMQSPTATQAKELALLGMTTNQLADDLKSKGLSGTLGEISDRIRKLMPPGSEKAILDMKTALQGLDPTARELAGHLFDGSMSMKDYSKAALELDPIAAKQAQSFATLVGSTHRIGDQQMTGAQIMQNYGQALYKATGDATGLNVALMLTGDNAGTAADAIKTVTDASTEAGNHVKGWSDIQSTFNQQLAQFKAGAEALGIKLGEKLMPTVKEILKDFADFGGKVKGTFDRPDVQAAIDNLDHALGKMSKDNLKELKKDLDDLAKFIDKNHDTISSLINFIANDVIPVLSWLSKSGIHVVITDFEMMIITVKNTELAFDAMRWLVVEAMKFMVMSSLGWLKALVDGAAWAFSWVPGLGPKLDQAKKWFDGFYQGVMNGLDRLNGKSADVYIHGHVDGTNLIQNGDTYSRAGSSVKFKAEGGPIEAYRPYVVGEHGPELIVPNWGGHVFTASQTRQILNGRSGNQFSAPRAGSTAGGGTGSSSGGGEPIVIQLVADGRKLYEVIVPHAQRHKGRNPTTALV